ncbi:MAG: hypothetical protein GY841_11235, partial [FCB group bacterium]|nr:hypothetical protein [FCB group bacterium]
GTTKDGTGSASIGVTGDFGAAIDLLYTVEIDDVSGGTENGEATFQWRTSENDVDDWEETGVVTRATPAYALSADGLGGGLSVEWVGRVGNDFALADEWRWTAKATYGSERLLDQDRQTFWKSTNDNEETIIIDLEEATLVTAVVIHDHNFTEDATITIQGNASDSWGSPTYEYEFTAITDPLFVYISETFRYWRILIEDDTNSDGFIQIGNIGLFEYLELTSPNSTWGSSEVYALKTQESESIPGRVREYFHAQQRQWVMPFPEVFSNDDVDSLIAMQVALIDSTTKRIKSLWVNWFAEDVAYMELMRWRNMREFTRNFRSYLLNNGVNLIFDEIVKISSDTEDDVGGGGGPAA